MLRIDWLVGKCFNIVSKGLLDSFACMVLNADDIQGIVLKFLFNKPVKFPLMFEFTINALIISNYSAGKGWQREFL